jgi:lipoprotein-anchoring transpeptidase ErfK/SrfK
VASGWSSHRAAGRGEAQLKTTMRGATPFAKRLKTVGLAVARVLVTGAIPAQVLPWTVAFALIVALSNTADAARRSRQVFTEFKKPEPRNDVGEIAKGPLQIVVSIADQHVTLYSNGVRVVRSSVSTGVAGHPTPMGVFSVIQKDRYHRSNIYSNAPMPFMQRITWSGIAMHEGPLPGHPASHGCIRLTHDFATRLWVTSKLGARVIVVRNDVVPVNFAHAHLFTPSPKPSDRPVASSEMAGPATVGEPAIPPQVGSAASELRKPPETSDPLKPSPPINYGAADQPAKRSGQLAIFVSRKEKRLFVRQGFAPLFDMPVTIDSPDQPLGTHVFTAMEVTDNGAGMRWNAVTLPNRQLRSGELTGKRRSVQEPTVPKSIEARAMTTAKDALDRIHIPQEAIDRIGELLIPGSSLVVSDQGLGPETGKGTDFIVVTP